jgi:hypothetical protein
VSAVGEVVRTAVALVGLFESSSQWCVWAAGVAVQQLGMAQVAHKGKAFIHGRGSATPSSRKHRNLGTVVTLETAKVGSV